MVISCSEVTKSDAEKESEARCRAMLSQLISAVKKQTLEMEDLAVRMNELAIDLKAIVLPRGVPDHVLPPSATAPTATLAAAVDRAVAAATPRAEAAFVPKSPTKCSMIRACDDTASRTSAFTPDVAPGPPSTAALIDVAITSPEPTDATVLVRDGTSVLANTQQDTVPDDADSGIPTSTSSGAVVNSIDLGDEHVPNLSSYQWDVHKVFDRMLVTDGISYGFSTNILVLTNYYSAKSSIAGITVVGRAACQATLLARLENSCGATEFWQPWPPPAQVGVMSSGVEPCLTSWLSFKCYRGGRMVTPEEGFWPAKNSTEVIRSTFSFNHLREVSEEQQKRGELLGNGAFYTDGNEEVDSWTMLFSRGIVLYASDNKKVVDWTVPVSMESRRRMRLPLWSWPLKDNGIKLPQWDQHNHMVIAEFVRCKKDKGGHQFTWTLPVVVSGHKLVARSIQNTKMRSSCILIQRLRKLCYVLVFLCEEGVTKSRSAPHINWIHIQTVASMKRTATEVILTPLGSATILQFFIALARFKMMRTKLAEVELNVVESFMQKLLGAAIHVVSQGSYSVWRSLVTEKDMQGLVVKKVMCILWLFDRIAELVVKTGGDQQMNDCCSNAQEETKIVPDDLSYSEPWLTRCPRSKFVHHPSLFTYKRMLPFLMENELSSQDGDRVKIRRVMEEKQLISDENDALPTGQHYLAVSEDSPKERNRSEVERIVEEKPSKSDVDYVLDCGQLQSAVSEVSPLEGGPAEMQQFRQGVLTSDGGPLSSDEYGEFQSLFWVQLKSYSNTPLVGSCPYGMELAGAASPQPPESHLAPPCPPLQSPEKDSREDTGDMRITEEQPCTDQELDLGQTNSSCLNSSSQCENQTSNNDELTGSESKLEADKTKGEGSSEEKVRKKPDKILACPRCNSMDTKFCYYNNYNINQPRHLCKSCQRYWTAGGIMRNVLVGAGRRKSKSSSANCRSILIPGNSLAAHGGDSSLFPLSRKGNQAAVKFGPDSPFRTSVLKIVEQSKNANPASTAQPRNGENQTYPPSAIASDSLRKDPVKGTISGHQNGITGHCNGVTPMHPIPCFPGPPFVYPWSPAWNGIPAMAAPVCPVPAEAANSSENGNGDDSFVSAWGQAAFQGGRNVTYRPDLEWASVVGPWPGP